MTSRNPTEYDRFCPGEEHIKISAAVCWGRRRANYPKCPSCPFNEEGKREGQAQKSVDTAGRSTESEPEHLESLFQADEIRGLWPDPLNVEATWRIGTAAAQFLKSELRGYDRSQQERATVLVGRDMHKSSPDLADALIDGLRGAGAPVIDLGMIDTPQLYFAVNHLTCCGGIQVTAGAQSPPANGFKIVGLRGRPVGIDTGLTNICKIAQNSRRRPGNPLAELSTLDLREPYIQFIRGFIRPNRTAFSVDRPLKIVVDAANGMAGRWFPLLFGEEDWLQISRINFEHNGEFLHGPNPLLPSNLTQLKDRCARVRSDLGLCFDGDAARCMVIDDTGQVVRPDLLTALLAGYLLKQFPGSTMLYDVRCSRIVPETIRAAGGSPRRERCGQTFIKKAMYEAKALFGGQLSGYLYFQDNGYCESPMIAFAYLVNLLADTGKPLGELLAPLRKYAHSGERKFYCPRAPTIIEELAARYEKARIDYLDGITVQHDNWWFNLRPVAAEGLCLLNLEAEDDDLMRRKLDELTPLLGTPA